MADTIDLVGPKGYKHGFIYVGGPGLPSTPPGRSRAPALNDRQRIAVQQLRAAGMSSRQASSKVRRSTFLTSGHQTPGYGTRHEGTGTHGIYRLSDGKRIGGVSTVGGGVHYAYREGVEGTTIHGSLTDAVKHVARADRADQRTIQAANIQAAIELSKGGHTPAVLRAAGRKMLASRNLALPDGSFPVPNGAYWDKARDSIGRVADPAKRAAVAKLLRRTAGRFGKTAALKNSWAAPGGSDHSNTGLAIQLADGPEPYRRGSDETVQCPNCGKYDAPDARYCDQCGHKLPDSAFANLSNPMELAMPTAPPAIRTPSDLVISRGPEGQAIIRHRAGGGEIGTIRREGQEWLAAIGGKDLAPRNHQRTALADLIGTHNKGSLTPQHRPSSAEVVLQPPPQQTPLMAQFGVPAIRALATPSTGSDDGPRMTSSSGGDDYSSGGLSAKGKQIYAKLIKKGFPAARAMAFAKRAENFGGSKS